MAQDNHWSDHAPAMPSRPLSPDRSSGSLCWWRCRECWCSAGERDARQDCEGASLVSERGSPSRPVAVPHLRAAPMLMERTCVDPMFMPVRWWRARSTVRSGRSGCSECRRRRRRSWSVHLSSAGASLWSPGEATTWTERARGGRPVSRPSARNQCRSSLKERGSSIPDHACGMGCSARLGRLRRVWARVTAAGVRAGRRPPARAWP
jgi:hypothetical protein